MNMLLQSFMNFVAKQSRDYRKMLQQLVYVSRAKANKLYDKQKYHNFEKLRWFRNALAKLSISGSVPSSQQFFQR